MPIHMDVPQKTIHRILGEILMKRPYLHLIVHAHRAEHQIKDIEHDDPDWNSFFLVTAALAEQFYNVEPIQESGGSACAVLKVICINFTNSALGITDF